MEDSLASLMRLDATIERFIEMYANSFIKWELIQYYHKHPNVGFRIEELSRNLNRPGRELKKEILEFELIGFLMEEKNGKSTSYAYRPGNDPASLALQQTLEHFSVICQEREGRLRVVYKLLKTGKPIVN